MTPSVQHCLDNAARYESLAAMLTEPELKAAYRRAAAYWWRMAEDVEWLEVESAARGVPWSSE